MNKHKIVILNFSKALIQQDILSDPCERTGYYDTQKGTLIENILAIDPSISIDLLGLNVHAVYKTDVFDEVKLVRFPFVFKSVIISLVIFNIYTIIYIIKNRKSFFLIYIYSNSELYPYVGALISSKLLGLPLFTCLRNPPESFISFRSQIFAEKFVNKLLEFMFFNESYKIIHISKKSKELVKKYPKFYQKSVIMGSSANSKIVIAKDKKIRGQLKFVYWGVINKSRDLDTIINGFMRFKKMNKQYESKFYLIGSGDDLNRLAKATETKDIVFLSYLKQKDLFEFIDNNSIAVIPIPPRDIFQYSSPLKLAEAVMMELPILASDIEPNQLVKNYGVGIICEHDINAYADAFLKFHLFTNSEISNFRENCKQVKHLFTSDNVFHEVRESILDEYNKI